MWETTTLRAVPGLDPEDPAAITAHLERAVTKMAAEARGAAAAGAARGAGAAVPPLPLVRLRVDYTGCSTINSQRFGQKFVNKARVRDAAGGGLLRPVSP